MTSKLYLLSVWVMVSSIGLASVVAQSSDEWSRVRALEEGTKIKVTFQDGRISEVLVASISEDAIVVVDPR